MVDITTRLALLSLDDNVLLKRTVQGYFLRLQNSQDFFLLQRRKICIKDIPGKSYLILEPKILEEGNVCVICPLCMDSAFVGISVTLSESDLIKIKAKSCEHALVSYLLWQNSELATIEVNDDVAADLVEVLPVQKYYVAVVHPSNQHSKKGSAPLRLSNRMVSPKCCFCKGLSLIHI